MNIFTKKSFTLLEILAVAIILGILASIGVLNLTGNLRRAKKTEAILSLGVIRTAEKIHRAEHGSYTAANPITQLDSIEPGCLGGIYFSEECYSAALGGTDQEFIATCDPRATADGGPNTAARAVEVSDYGDMTIDQDGVGGNWN